MFLSDIVTYQLEILEDYQGMQVLHSGQNEHNYVVIDHQRENALYPDDLVGVPEEVVQYRNVHEGSNVRYKPTPDPTHAAFQKRR